MKKYLIILMFIGILLLMRCGDNGLDSSIPEMTGEELLSSGWSEFEKGNYTKSKEHFLKLIGKRDEFLVDAYTGLGWSESRLNLYVDAINSFNTALEYPDTSTVVYNDIYAGLSFAYDALDRHQDCLDTTENVNGNWHFSHDTTLDYNDIILLKAINYYALGCKENENNFPKCLEEVQRLEPDFNIDISTTGGRGQLAVKIEELKNQV